MKPLTGEIWVLGLGSSGDAAARLLAREGRPVRVLDRREDGALAERATALRALGVDVRLGLEELPSGRPVLAVVSPGIPEDGPWLCDLRGRGVACRSEIEMAWERRRAPVVAVTGPNGKTTAVHLLDHVLCAGGIRTVTGGNCGPPLSAVVDQDAGWLVVEVSSFQLETVERFRPDIGILLNIQPNHLDRHPSMERYRWAKGRLFAAAGPDDLCLVPHDLAPCIRSVSGGGGAWRTFGSSLDADVRYHDGRAWLDGTPMIDFRASPFANEVTGPMVCAVVAACRRIGLDPDRIEAAIAGFRGLPHRMQAVGSVDGVDYVNDSKATSLSALRAALLRIPGPIRLIAGGVLKERNLRLPADELRQRVAAAYVIGEGAPTLHAAWADVVECTAYPGLEEAFAAARRDARAGETILLSPGAASFDQFSSYRERGERFAQLVARTAGSEPAGRGHGNPIDNPQGSARMTECRNETKEICA